MNRRRTDVPVVGCVAIGKVALPDVAAMFTARSQFVAPGINGVLQPTARGHFPFGFGWQPGP